MTIGNSRAGDGEAGKPAYKRPELVALDARATASGVTIGSREDSSYNLS